MPGTLCNHCGRSRRTITVAALRLELDAIMARPDCPRPLFLAVAAFEGSALSGYRNGGERVAFCDRCWCALSARRYGQSAADHEHAIPELIHDGPAFPERKTVKAPTATAYAGR